MVIKLNKTHINYLINILLKDSKGLNKELHITEEDTVILNQGVKFITIQVDDGIADKIRNLVCNELQTSGFDVNYELTPNGKILEELIDIFGESYK
ncbi:MAG: hypothetical protein LBD57_04060 [Endomicrobium sp.]|jgi:hypothetical protein|uniref:hypothetical protein n=1 Tax=Candidatus Endomicrobiellum cubanum TaxID=3242325 RepID=UPI0028362665|nr:hypothetical protein [Endomicrobium sp.]